MKICIYQINENRDEHNVMFLNKSSLAKFQGSAAIDSSIYDKVYEDDVPAKDLEQIYQIFNFNHPSNYRGRSLSISDVVEVVDKESGKSTFYFCDSFGFTQVDFHPEECKTLEERNGKLRVLLVEPNKCPRMIEIGESLEEMQEVVGGYIEEYMPFSDEVAIVCNEDGKANGLELNRAIYSEDETHRLLDIIAGKFFICYAPYDAERFQSLPEHLAKKYEQMFQNPEHFYQKGNSIVAVPFHPASKDKER